MRACIAVLLLLDAVVLLGQCWPEGAPPFARAVNIAALAGTIAFLAACLLGRVQLPRRPAAGR